MRTSSQVALNESQLLVHLGLEFAYVGPWDRLFDRITLRYLSGSVDFRMTPHNS